MSTQQLMTKSLFGQKSIQQRFETLLGKKTPGFISSVLQVVNANKLLQNADPNTVLNAAATAASLDLPINPNLGFSWIIPYKGRAQFQMGWRGYVQLALRTGKYKGMNVVELYDNQFKSYNALTEKLDADFTIQGKGDIVGVVAYFSLINGFEKTCYWPMEEIIKHAKKYSQTYGKKSGNKLIHSPWNDEDQFISMCKKTVLKNTISRWGIMSIQMEHAQLADQSVQEKEGDYRYIDNETPTLSENNQSEEDTRILSFIENADSVESLKEIKDSVDDDALLRLSADFDNRENELILDAETKKENAKGK